MGEGGEGGDVGVDHPLPLGEVGLLGGAGAQGEAGVVDQQVDAGEGGREGRQGGVAGGLVGDVERGGVDVVGAEGFDQRVEPVGPAAGGDHPPAGLDERVGGGLADAGGGSGDQGGLGHAGLLSFLVRAADGDRERPLPQAVRKR